MVAYTSAAARGRADTFVLVFAVCAVIAFGWHLQRDLYSDVAYFIVMDRKVLAGAWPYRDILETNPPLIFALMMPPVWLEAITGIAAKPLFLLYMIGLAGGATALSARIRTNAGGDFLLPVMVVSLLLLPGPAFGQREHFLVILATPYLVAAIARAEGRPVPASLAFAAGIMAACGFALKPYFLLIPVLVEIGLVVQARSIRETFRPESIVAAALVALYPLAVLWATPDYFSIIVPLAARTYSAYNNDLTTILIGSPLFPVAAALIGASLLILRQTGTRSAAAMFLCLASGASLLAFIIQMKGWLYQAYPAYAFGSAAFVLALVAARQHLGQPGRFMLRLACFATGGLLLANVILTQMLWVGLEREQRDLMDAALAGETPRRVLTLTHLLKVPFPYVEERGLDYAGTYPSLWMMPATVTGAMTAAEKASIVAYSAGLVAQTLEREKPDHVIVDRTVDARLDGRDLDYVATLSADPRFASAWDAYELVRSGPLDVWRRRAQAP
ncbi:hypothetical protein BH10PSE7_BH10PSE7_21800 [soil metagenome]